MQRDDKISVIIPTYNREKTIQRAIDSVLNQTYRNLELLIVDDGSTDGTREIVEQIKDLRVQYIRLEKNSGVSNARNEGARRATSEWIAFQDSDDCWREDKLEKQMAYALEHPEYDMVYGSYLAHLENGKEIICPAKPLPEILEGEMFCALLRRNVIGAPTVLVKRACFLECGGFNVIYNSLEDWEYAIRFARNHRIGFVPDVLMDAYVMRGGISSGLGAYFESRCRMLVEYGMEIIEAGLLEEIVVEIMHRAKIAGAEEIVEKMVLKAMEILQQNM